MGGDEAVGLKWFIEKDLWMLRDEIKVIGFANQISS